MLLASRQNGKMRLSQVLLWLPLKALQQLPAAAAGS
jgi:hypothetical protein